MSPFNDADFLRRRRDLIQPEHMNYLPQTICFILHGMRRRCRLLHQRGIFLGNFVHLGDRLIHLLDAMRLFLAGSCDFAHDARHLAHTDHHFVHRAAGLRNEFVANADFLHRIIY